MPGLIQIFEEIWDERDHVSQISGEPLLPKGHPKWHWQFMHILTKRRYPRLKFDKRNIILGTVDEHDYFDNKGGTSSDPKWKWVYDRMEELKSEDHATIRTFNRK